MTEMEPEFLACKSGKRMALSDGNDEVKFWKSLMD